MSTLSICYAKQSVYSSLLQQSVRSLVIELFHRLLEKRTSTEPRYWCSFVFLPCSSQCSINSTCTVAPLLIPSNFTITRQFQCFPQNNCPRQTLSVVLIYHGACRRRQRGHYSSITSAPWWHSCPVHTTHATPRRTVQGRLGISVRTTIDYPLYLIQYIGVRHISSPFACRRPQLSGKLSWLCLHRPQTVALNIRLWTAKPQ